MLRFLANISPVAVLLLGAIPAGAVAWFSHGLKFEVFDRPAIIREATIRADDACTIRTMEAANRAESVERERQRAAGAKALTDFAQRNIAENLEREAQISQLEQEIADYETQLAETGRSCLLDSGAVDWLRGIVTPAASQ